MKKIKILILVTVIFLLMTIISAEPITLFSLNISTDSEWCIGKFNTIYIVTLQQNQTFAEVDNIDIKIPQNISYQVAPIYQRENVYVSHIQLNNNNNSLETINLTISVDQRGKIVEEVIEIKIIEKGCTESKVSGFFSNAEKFIVEHSIVLIICTIIIVLIIVAIKISKLK